MELATTDSKHISKSESQDDRKVEIRKGKHVDRPDGPRTGARRSRPDRSLSHETVPPVVSTVVAVVCVLLIQIPLENWISERGRVFL